MSPEEFKFIRFKREGEVVRLTMARPDHNLLKHTLIPGFGLIANLVCMGFYVAGPFFNLGTKMEPLTALGIAGVWGLYGAVYFLRTSKSKGKAVLLETKKVAS